MAGLQSLSESQKSAIVPTEPVQVDTQEPTRFGMLKRFSLFVRILCSWIYSRVVHEPTQVQEILAIPRDESIVYLLSIENKHDFLFFNDLCLKTGMPLAYTSNGKGKLRYAPLWHRFIGLFSKRLRRFSASEIAQAAAERRPILLFLNQYGIGERENTARTDAVLASLARIVHDSSERKIHLVTVGIIWERRAESYLHTALNEIYGTPTRPSSIRRFLSVIPGVLNLFFKIGKPLCLIHHQVFNDEHCFGVHAEGPYLSGSEMRRALSDEIDGMHTQVNGPKVKPHQVLLREIITSPEFQAEIKTIAQATCQTETELTIEARKILDRAASKFSLLTVKLVSAFLAPMWSMIYNGLYYDTEQLNEIRELSKTHRIVFIPSHKSHVDYLVLSCILFQNGLLPPHIAAGDNLNFIPIGSILRRGGAFFIKRSFRGEQLYTACIRHYVAKIMQEGYPVEFFIEGGRSRTGQVLQPKYGMLRMIAQAVQDHPDMPTAIVPCAITYEKVIEDMAYKKEQDGAVKQKENFSNLIRTTKLLISKYGQIYVSFAKPICMNSALGIEPRAAALSDDALTKNIDTMALDLMDRINRSTTITMSSLLSCALLNTKDDRLSSSDLISQAGFMLSLLIERGALITPVLQNVLAAGRVKLMHSEDMDEDSSKNAASNGAKNTINNNTKNGAESRCEREVREDRRIDPMRLESALRGPILETIRLFEQNGEISQHRSIGNPDEAVIELDSSSRLQLSFYRNILLYALIDDIYLASVIISLNSHECTKTEIVSKYNHLSQLLSIEFSPNQDEKPLEETIHRFIKRGWLNAEGDINSDKYSIEASAIPHIRTLHRCLEAHITGYYFVFSSAEALISSPTEESKVISSLMSLGRKDIESKKYLPESRSKVLYSHAIEKLKAMGSISVSYEQNGRKYAKFLSRAHEVPTGDIEFLRSLCTELH